MPNGPKLRVGLVFDDSLDTNDGVAQYVKTLGGWLVSQGHTVTYLVGDTKAGQWKGGKIVSLSRNIKVYFNGNKLSMPLFPKLGLMGQVIDEGRFDVLHVMLPCSPLMASRLVARASAKTKVVGTFHIFPAGRLSRAGSRLLRLFLYRTLRRMDAVISVSRPAQGFAARYYGIESTILPNPVRIADFRTNTISDKGSDIVFLGRLVERKGCNYLIKAFNLLSQSNKDAKLIIAGTGPEEDSLKRAVKDYDLSDKVSFLGYVDERDKAKLLASATVACFPSLYGESFGIVLIEAMAAGAGVVLGGNNPGYSSVLAEKPELLIDPKNTERFAERLDTLLQNEGLRESLREWQNHTVKQYDIEAVGPKVMDLYTSSIDKAHENGHNNSNG